MLNLVLKIIAVVTGLLIVCLFVIKLTGGSIGIRIGGNMFADQIAGISVYSWLLGILALIEFGIFVLLFITSRDKTLLR
jgi:hypothetical protein